MSELEIKPGTILLEKKYNVIKKMIAWLFKKELPYNKIHLAIEKIGKLNSVYYTPKKEYSKVEIAKLDILLEDASLSIVEIINLIRPNTITNVDTFKVNDITKNKYYALVDGKEKKHISRTSK